MLGVYIAECIIIMIEPTITIVSRIDMQHTIKVSDFGLSEEVYSKNYFQQVQSKEGGEVNLPMKWMSLESLKEGVFTEKTDVVG